MPSSKYTQAQCEAILAQLEDAALRFASGTPEISMSIDGLGEQLTLSPKNIESQVEFWEERRDRAIAQAAGGSRGQFRAFVVARRRPA
jgi:hypothetical protein